MKILFVEDHPSVAKLTILLLEEYGHQVEHCSSGVEAIKVLQQFSPDLALIDIGLPGMNGYELAERIRNDIRFEELLLVALSGYASDHDRERSKKSGFALHYAKPIEVSVLADLDRMVRST